MTQPRTGGEKQILSAFLDQQRDVVLWKLDGLTDDQLRQPITPGGLYLLGLVKHLAGADRHPASGRVGGRRFVPFRAVRARGVHTSVIPRRPEVPDLQGGSNPVWAFKGCLTTRISLRTVGQVCRGRRESWSVIPRRPPRAGLERSSRIT